MSDLLTVLSNECSNHRNNHLMIHEQEVTYKNNNKSNKIEWILTSVQKG